MSFRKEKRKHSKPFWFGSLSSPLFSSNRGEQVKPYRYSVSSALFKMDLMK